MAIYLDNAATSYPKPPEMLAAMSEFQNNSAANPGRSGHRMSVDAGRTLYDCRDAAANLFGVENPLDIAFAMNATMALNIAIGGLLKSGDHIVTTSMEHNSVARPLRWAETNGCELTIVQADPITSHVKAPDILAAVTATTKLVVMTHASNVTGAINPIAEVGNELHKRGIPLLVDAAQTAGAVPINVEEMGVSMLAFTGHKSMFGPMGTGGLYVSPEIKLNTIMRGGTGSRSEEDIQPEFMPDLLESGTPNTIGLSGLAAGIEYINRIGMDVIAAHKRELAERFLAALPGIPQITLYGPSNSEQRLPNFALNIDDLACSEVAQRLDDDYGILVRAGLQCAPWAHQTLGTYPSGAVRFSFGYFNTETDVDAAVAALREIAG
jgi:cysteine desulfurase / selenocysteine lyase